jgi:hypothetical protein
VAAPFLVVVDFVEKLNKLLPVFVLAALAVFFILLWISRTNKLFSVRSAGVRSFMLVVFFLGGACWIAQGYVGDARANGLIAETVPGADAFQQQVLAILGTLKKETSDDPHKELVNLGHTDKPRAWSVAFRDGDVRVLKLLIQAKYEPENPRGTPPFLLALRLDGRWQKNPEFIATLRHYRSQITNDICSPSLKEIEYLIRAIEKLGIAEYRFYCGKNIELLKKLQTELLASWDYNCKVLKHNARLHGPSLDHLSCAIDQIPEYKRLVGHRRESFSIFGSVEAGTRQIDTLRKTMTSD